MGSPLTFLPQEGFGAFGANSTIPTLIDPGGAFGDPSVWLVQYIPAQGFPARLRSMIVQGMRQDDNAPSFVAQAVPYWIGVGPYPQDAQVAAVTPVPAALFTSTTYPLLPNNTFATLAATYGFTIWEAGLADVNPWWERTWSEHEIIATDGNQIVVAVGTPIGMAGAPQTEPNTLLWLSVQGYNDAPVYSFKEPSLAKYPR